MIHTIGAIADEVVVWESLLNCEFFFFTHHIGVRCVRPKRAYVQARATALSVYSGFESFAYMTYNTMGIGIL